MRVADESAHRGLVYVAAVTRHGYRLSPQEFEAYMASPRRKAGFDPVAMMRAVMAPPESTLAWMHRVGWLQLDRGAVTLTPLGSAVLRSLEEEDVEPGASVSIATTDDALAYPRVIGLIAERGEALLVDPFFRLESWLHVLNYTSVSRLLIGPNADCEALAVAAETLPEGRELEIRVSADVHDRFVVPESGSVDHMGTSLSGLGKKLTVSAPIAPPAADGIRSEVERAWGTAAPVQDAVKKTSGRE